MKSQRLELHKKLIKEINQNLIELLVSITDINVLTHLNLNIGKCNKSKNIKELRNILEEIIDNMLLSEQKYNTNIYNIFKNPLKEIIKYNLQYWYDKNDINFIFNKLDECNEEYYRKVYQSIEAIGSC